MELTKNIEAPTCGAFPTKGGTPKREVTQQGDTWPYDMLDDVFEGFGVSAAAVPEGRQGDSQPSDSIRLCLGVFDTIL